MLARSFLSAADLKLPEMERGALIKVLHMLERGELVEVRRNDTSKPNGFCMSTVSAKSDCGSVGCILGWARFVTNEQVFDFWNPKFPLPRAASVLFMYGDDRRHRVTIDQAIRGLSNYLTTGRANWDQVLA